jgi:hypothetical protein
MESLLDILIYFETFAKIIASLVSAWYLAKRERSLHIEIFIEDYEMCVARARLLVIRKV